uniref:Putative golgin imh1 n=1 Tax=Lutzomyia longipalpis TaxID=7200 RepID=A0A1B0CIB9_LUTLO
MEASLLGGKLIFLKKNGKNRVVYTTRGSAVRFGKDLLCHFRLRHPNACKIHCKICIGRIGKVQIINYSTDQSVAVNDKIVMKKQFIKSGDQISILGMNFVWEFTPIVDALKTTVRKSSPLSMRPAEMKRACWSEPGRRKKLKRLNKETIVSILTPVRKRRRFSGVPELKIGVPEDEKKVPESVEQPKTPEKNLLEGTGIVSPNLPRQSINLMSFQTPKTLRGDNSTAESTMKDSTVVAATIDGSRSLYGTPVGPSLEGTRASPEQPSNLIDLNTPAPTKGDPEKLCADSDASDFFKTPLKQIRARGLKTPSSIAPQTAAKVDFTSLPQSTPIDVTKRLDVNEESTIIDVDQSESVITIDDSSETLKTPENSIKFIGEASKIDDSSATPKRTLRSATKSSVASTKKLQEVNAMTPKTPQSTRRNAKTPQSAVSVKKQPQDITPRTSTLPRSTRKSSRTPQSVKKVKGEDLEDFSTPKQVRKIIRRPVTSAKKLKERKIEAKLNTSDTTGEKPQPTVSQLRGLMTMENLTNITSGSDVFDKENMTSPQATTLSEDHQLRSLQKENNMPNMTPTPAKKQLKSLSAVKSGRVTKTPRSPLNNLSNISGVKNLFGTQQKSPKAVQRHHVVASSPLNDLTDVGGVRRLFRTPGRGKKDDLTDIVGVRELLATPKSTNKLEDIVGVRELMKTPLEDVTVDLRGVRELMQDLPKDETSVRLAGIRDLMKSPEEEGASPDLRGVRKLLKSPVDQDLSMDLRGIREIMKEPKEADYSVVYAGVKDLMKEPKEGDMSLKFTGVKELMKEPTGDKTINYAGLRDIMKPSTSKDTSFAMVGVKELLKEPVDVETTQNLTGMADLYTIPEESKPLSQGEDAEEASKPTSSSTSVVEVIELDATVDQLFDSLKGLTSMPSVQRTYSRKESPKKVQTPEKIEKGGDDKGIQEWIDSIVLSTTNENAHSRRANNTLQVLSDKYSNVTATESEQLLTESIDNNPESEDVAEDNATNDIPSVRRETTGRDVSLRKLAIAQSFAETEKNLLSVNDTFDFGHGVTSTPKTPRLKVDQLTEIAPRRSPRLQRTTEILLKTPEVSSTKEKNEATSAASANDKPRRGRKPKAVTFAVTFAVPESPAAVSSSTKREV